MRLLIACRWSGLAVLLAVLAMAAFGAANWLAWQRAAIIARHQASVAEGKAEPAAEDTRHQAEPWIRRGVVTERVGLAFWLTGVVCLGLSIARRERSHAQSLGVVLLTLAALLQLLMV